MLTEEIGFQEALTWLNGRVGEDIGLTVADRNWSVSIQGALAIGPGERQLVEHLGGVVRDYLVADARVQLCEDDLDHAAQLNEPDGEGAALFLHMRGGTQVNFSGRAS